MFLPPVDPFEELHTALDTCAQAAAEQWCEPVVADAVVAWCAAASKFDAVGARLLARWDHQQGWALDGAANATQWLSARGGLEHPGRTMAIARNLERYAPLTSAALFDDELSYAKAAALVAGVNDQLAESFAANEKTLVETAKVLTLAQTRRLASQWKAIAELDREPDDDPDATRRAQRYLKLTTTFDGMVAIEGLLDPEIGAALKQVIAQLERRHYRQDVTDARNQHHADGHDTHCDDIDASTSDGQPIDNDDPDNDDPDNDEDDPADLDPRHRDGDPIRADELGRTARQRRADALADLLDHYQATAHRGGGPRAHLHLTATWDQLHDAVTGRPRRDCGLRLPTAIDPDAPAPAQTDHHPYGYPGIALARDACDCILTRLTLDADGVPLNLGRTQRLVSPAQRRALIKRDGGCSFPGCDRGPEWCDAHHLIPWEIGGRTDLDNLALLCRKHHTRMHEREPWHCAMDQHRRPTFAYPDGRPLPHPGPHRKWRPPGRPPGRPPDDPPARVTAAA